MITPFYRFNAGKVQGSKLFASEVNYLHRIVDSQVTGALAALGFGVLVDGLLGVSNPLLVTQSGNGVTVAVGAAITRETVNGYGFVYMRLGTAQTLAFNDFDEGDNFVYLAPVYASGGSTDDTRAGSSPEVFIDSTETAVMGTGALLLARVEVTSGVITAVEDKRTLSSLEQLLQRVQQLEDDLGYSDAERAKGTVAERLNALSGPPGEEGEPPTVITKLAQLIFDDEFPRNAITVIREEIAASEARCMAAAQSGGFREQQTKLDNLYAEHAQTRRGLISLVPNAGEITQSANITKSTDGVFGIGTNSHPDYIDTDLTINSDGDLEP